jgi:PAS domain S-box-containing protein
MLSEWLSDNLDYLIVAAGACGLFAVMDWGLRRRSAPATVPRVFWLAMVATVLAGFFFVQIAGTRPQRRLIELLQGIAPTYASELERLGHATLRIEGAESDPRYLEMIEAVKRWTRLNPLVSDIYTYRRAPGGGGGVVLMVDAETDYDRDGKLTGEREARTHPGEPYPQAGDELRRAFDGEANFMATPVTDRWGTWVSMHVPMRDALGRVEAVLDVDYPAELWRAENLERRRVALVYLGLMVLVLGGSGVMVAVNRAELAARSAAEARLRTSDARLRAMLDHLPFALWLLDAGGRCRAHNARAAATLGAAEGRTLDEFTFDPEERAALEEDGRRARAGAVVTRETARGQGESRRHVFRLFAPVAEAPHRTGLVAVELDVTDRVEAEQARRRFEQRLALHMQQTPLAYVEWGPDRRVLRWNPAAERIFGYSAAEATGRPFDELILPDTATAEVDEVCQQLLARKGGMQSVNENRTKDGRIITCEWHNTPLVDADGRVIAVASHAQDVTERVALEQRLRTTQRMESIGQLAGGVAHEFNNLLTPMLMQMGQIAAAYAGDARLVAMLRPVEDSIMQAAQLNQRILAVGRQATDTPGLMNLNPLVEAAADLLSHTLDRRIELKLELAVGLPPALLTKGAVTQVVMNLALNARDALLARLERGAPAGWSPRLGISTACVAHAPASAPETLRRAPSCLVLTITDNGEGMSAEVRRRAFEPFFTTKASGKGTGLGLAVVWNVVEGLGGVIDLRTSPGAGASFTIHLPVVRPEDVPMFSDAPSAPRRTEPSVEPLRVLLVEDNELVRETFREVLSQAGHYVACANDGADGLACLEESAGRPYDVLVADLNMPRLSGKAMLERIQGRGYARGVLVVSGLVDPGLGEELLRLGVDRVMRKPVGMGDLLAAVAEVGRRKPPAG